MEQPVFISELERKEREKAFLEKARERHGDKFDYSKVRYVNNMQKVVIVCKIHGEFRQSPVKHIRHKYACPKCARIGWGKARRTDREEFLKMAKALYGDIYDYEKTVLRKKEDAIDVYCKKHKQTFSQRMISHLQGRIGCKECLKERKEQEAHEKFKRNFIEQFTEKFGKEYDFSKAEYVNNKTPVTVICKKHNVEFKQVHRNIKRFPSCACPECKKEHKMRRKTEK